MAYQQPPQQAYPYQQPPFSPYVPCPRCGNPNVQKVGWTLWGGALGPRLLNHVKCPNCGMTYNGKTGQSNMTKIILYQAIPVLILIVLFVLLAL